MRSVLGMLLVFATVAEAQMGHDLRPALGVDAPEGYESVAASDGSGLPPAGALFRPAEKYTSPSARHVMVWMGNYVAMRWWAVPVRWRLLPR